MFPVYWLSSARPISQTILQENIWITRECIEIHTEIILALKQSKEETDQEELTLWEKPYMMHHLVVTLPPIIGKLEGEKAKSLPFAYDLCYSYFCWVSTY